LYNSFYEYENYLPVKFFEAIKNKTLFDNEILMNEFEAWCKSQIESYNRAGKAIYEKRSDIAQKFDESAWPLFERSFHDGEILYADQRGEDFILFMDMRGGFTVESIIELTFHQAHLEGNVEGDYVYDELVETEDGFALRILSSYGSPYVEGTIYFENVSANGLFRPVVYVEPGDVKTWPQFVEALNPEDNYFVVNDYEIIPIDLASLKQTSDGIFAGELYLGQDYEQAKERIYCATYEDPYAHFREPVPKHELLGAIFSGDQTLSVRAFNTVFALGEEVAEIVNKALRQAEVGSDDGMYFSVMAHHFQNLHCLEEELKDKWLTN
jgi:hypothetical protein